VANGAVELGRRSRAALAAAGTLFILALMVASAFQAHAQDRLVVLGFFTGPQGEQVQEFLNEYGEANGVDVELILASSWIDLADRAVSMSVGGIAPDLIFSDQLRMHQLRGAGMVEPLNPWIERSGVDMSIFPTPVLRAMSFGGEVYGLPIAAALFNAYYNASRFEERGLDPIPADWTAPGWDWDEFVTTAQRLTYDTSGDGVPDHFGVQGFGSFGVNMIGMWGLHWVNEDRTRFVGTSPEVVEAMTRIWSLWTEYGVMGGSFTGGTAGMTFSQTQFLATLASLGDNLFNWSIGVVPKGTERPSQVGVLGFYMHSHSRNKEAAWQLLRFLGTTYEAAARMSQITERMPVQPDAVARWAESWQARFPGVPIASVIQAFDYAWDWWAINGASAGEHLQLMTEMSQRVVQGELAPRQAIELYAPAFQALLDSERR